MRKREMTVRVGRFVYVRRGGRWVDYTEKFGDVDIMPCESSLLDALLRARSEIKRLKSTRRNP